MLTGNHYELKKIYMHTFTEFLILATYKMMPEGFFCFVFFFIASHTLASRVYDCLGSGTLIPPLILRVGK